MMEVIAINKEENCKIVICGDRFMLQHKICRVWIFGKDTKQEWRVSKWITDFGLKVSSDYPTIQEIKDKQNRERLENK